MRILLISLFAFFSQILFGALQPPKLVVQLVVDQLRGDQLQQYHHLFTENGFNYLLKHSINYQNAHHPHANTTTCVGHATIATGSHPSLHGIISNEWYDRDTGKSVYCAEDLSQKILPTNRMRIVPEGRSPSNLRASTLADELVLARKGRAFAVSLKDRSAIMLAGHAGKAFWFDKENGGFVSSEAYYKSYPEWVNVWNKSYKADNITWNLTGNADDYKFAKAQGFRNRFPGFGDAFPHMTGPETNPLYYKYLSMMPYADELTADFAIELIKTEKPGQLKNSTDYLGISFSATDAIGHQFGINSLEAEDNLRRLDLTIARLLKAIDAGPGLQNTLIILTADHGMTDSQVYLTSHGIKSPPRPSEDFLKEKILECLTQDLHAPDSIFESIEHPFIYLNHREIEKQNLNLALISNKISEKLSALPGVFQAISLAAPHSAGWLSDKVSRMAYPERSGDIYLVYPPWQSGETLQLKMNHGSPWRYDSYVPLLFVNPRLSPQKISREVQTTDIAATLAVLLDIKEPTACTGSPLNEVILPYVQQ